MAENTSQVDCRPSDPANLVTQDKINNFFAKPKPKSKPKPKPAPEVDVLPVPPSGGAAEEAKAGGEEGGAAATERSGSIQPVIKEITVPDNRYQVSSHRNVPTRLQYMDHARRHMYAAPHPGVTNGPATTLA